MSVRRFVVLAGIAFQTLRANPLHTLLSTLGLVIGVAAFVAILSLGDGLEQYARDQISTTTSLESVVVEPLTRRWVGGVSIERDTLPDLQLEQVARLAVALRDSAKLAMGKRINIEVGLTDDTLRTGAYLDITQPEMFEVMRVALLAGRLFDLEDLDSTVLVLSNSLALKLNDRPEVLIGRSLNVGIHEGRIIGVVDGPENALPTLYGPYAVWQNRLKSTFPPGLLVRTHRVEDVPAIKARIEFWLDANVNTGSEAFNIYTNQARVAQAQKGIRLFKIVMGMITGIAVLVGGIGIMNVLLISITERTREIGIRKATGAQRSYVIMQFLTESIAISITGSLIGLLAGLGVLALALPIVRNITEAPFQMGFSWQSFVVVLLVALLIGIVFGTYPAWRAARLSPVEAIRHE